MTREEILTQMLVRRELAWVKLRTSQGALRWAELPASVQTLARIVFNAAWLSGAQEGIEVVKGELKP